MLFTTLPKGPVISRLYHVFFVFQIYYFNPSFLQLHTSLSPSLWYCSPTYIKCLYIVSKYTITIKWNIYIFLLFKLFVYSYIYLTISNCILINTIIFKYHKSLVQPQSSYYKKRQKWLGREPNKNKMEKVTYWCWPYESGAACNTGNWRGKRKEQKREKKLTRWSWYVCSIFEMNNKLWFLQLQTTRCDDSIHALSPVLSINILDYNFVTPGRREFIALANRNYYTDLPLSTSDQKKKFF